ncbi:hypothetical protein [Azotobacter chroococcum]|uniref:Uncharacterized protein n=1 Tax=Azotobacter chroococcum TaxID=353 RepID=A0AAP9YHB1_9GAMM|nr:hypothetical protein [Azotobacter chroococcum]QQE90490.1 hypothetical protein GKQ51_09540 [Azotobacter chroococcum]
MINQALFHQGLFHIPSVAKGISAALKRDGCIYGEAKVESILNAALQAYGAGRHDDYLGPTVMFAVFADLVDGIGADLGEPVDKEGFALDWTGGRYPHLEGLAMSIAQTCVKEISAASAAHEAMSGYGFGDVFVRMMEQGIGPEEAAKQLQAERIQPTKH